MTLNCLYLLIVSPPRNFQIRTACWRIFRFICVGTSSKNTFEPFDPDLVHVYVGVFFFCSLLTNQCCKNKSVHMQLHMQALRWRNVHAKPTGRDVTSQRSDVSPNQKPEEKK